MFAFKSLVAAFTAAWLITTFAFGATRLPPSEVQALKDIGKTLGKTNWNFSVDPCGGEEGWVGPTDRKETLNYVYCDCSFFDDTFCHVTSIVLKSQSLPGTLPSDLGRLPYLQEIDLTRNYLSGIIPPQWGSMQLVNISIMANRLTGPIPKELGNISTLANLTLEFNQLSGSLPPELGNLSNISKLHLNSNSFTGQLPSTFEKLTTLEDFKIGDNNFTGQIPDFIQNWKNLKKLVIQGSGLSGPIPPGIANLENINDLRISDLGDGFDQQPLPSLSRMTKKLKTLILRSCNIADTLPDYFGRMEKLTILDLSFNKLSGQIPPGFSALANHADFLYLSGNRLSDTIPDWIFTQGKNIDLSYNNFTIDERTCGSKNVNLFGNPWPNNIVVSQKDNCLSKTRCKKKFYSFHINCGGRKTNFNGSTYEDDTYEASASRFYEYGSNWAVSSTGHFMDDNSTDFSTTELPTELSTNLSAIYKNARLSPISLTYYGFCMGNGNYTVNLHFAEIMFFPNNSYYSLGRRIFDIYIQGKLVQKNFNIADEAGGFGKAIIKNFTAIVTNQSLEIRFYWAGKGTTGIPLRGVYGPLISAISVTPNFVPPPDGHGITIGIVIGIVIGALVIISLVLGIVWRMVRSHRKANQEWEGLDLQTGLYTLRRIKIATNNFDPANKIGEGGFGSVYKGILSDGTVIAVKKLSSKSKQGNREFVNEIGMISALQHPHLVKLYGCCIEGDQLLLVYEYMENNSLARALFDPESNQLKLNWPMRQKICIGIARGLAFLHEESRLKIVHRDIKATNVLLDSQLDPKISDFGLAKLVDQEQTHISTRIAGTYGYMAPEYAMRGYLTDKADVYSFGIVALEIVSGRSNTIYRSKTECFYLLDWANVIKEKGSLLELVDPRLGNDYNEEEVIRMINVALLCTNVALAARPTMSSVVSMLEGKIAIEEFVALDSSISKGEIQIEAMRKHFETINEKPTSETQSMLRSDVPSTSSTSVADLYPIMPDTNFWEEQILNRP